MKFHSSSIIIGNTIMSECCLSCTIEVECKSRLTARTSDFSGRISLTLLDEPKRRAAAASV